MSFTHISNFAYCHYQSQYKRLVEKSRPPLNHGNRQLLLLSSINDDSKKAKRCTLPIHRSITRQELRCIMTSCSAHGTMINEAIGFGFPNTIYSLINSISKISDV